MVFASGWNLRWVWVWVVSNVSLVLAVSIVSTLQWIRLTWKLHSCVVLDLCQIFCSNWKQVIYGALKSNWHRTLRNLLKYRKAPKFCFCVDLANIRLTIVSCLLENVCAASTCKRIVLSLSLKLKQFAPRRTSYLRGTPSQLKHRTKCRKRTYCRYRGSKPYM